MHFGALVRKMEIFSNINQRNYGEVPSEYLEFQSSQAPIDLCGVGSSDFNAGLDPVAQFYPASHLAALNSNHHFPQHQDSLLTYPFIVRTFRFAVVHC